MDRIGGLVSAMIAVGRIALGFIALAVVAAAIVASTDMGNPARTQPIDLVRPGDMHTLRVPEGELTGNLTVLDESGRPLATLTRWTNGDLAFVAGRGGIGVALWLNEGRRTAAVSVAGTSRQTHLTFHPDGTAGPPRVEAVAGAAVRGEPRE